MFKFNATTSFGALVKLTADLVIRSIATVRFTTIARTDAASAETGCKAKAFLFVNGQLKGTEGEHTCGFSDRDETSAVRSCAELCGRT